MARKGLALALAAALAVLFSGCSFAGLGAQTLMHAPRPTGENEADIQALLEQTAGGPMTLKYPAAGQYRSAIVTHDLCGDKSSEAIAFYQKGDESSGTNVVFMRKDGGKWKSIGVFNNPATQVDRVCFGNLNGDGHDEAIVGWGSSQNNTGTICVYSFDGGRMNELRLNQSYTEMAVMDFDGDGKDEIFTASVTVGDQPSAARLLRIKDGAMEVMGTAKMDAGVTKYVSVKTGLVNEKQRGIVLDGIKSANMMVTELFYWNKKTGTLDAPFYDPATKSAKSTVRSTSVVSEDINGDSIIEIPLVTLLPGYSGTAADESDYLTSWHRYDTATNTFVRVMSMIIDYSDSYWFSIPDMWRGRITTKMDTATRTMTFYEWMATPKSAAGIRGPELLKIEVFTRKEWDSGSESQGFFQLATKENLVFAASRPSPNNPIAMTEGETRDAFKLIEQN